MAKQSAGLLVYRFAKSGPEVFLVHPGGPFWKRKDLGAWSIPKGEVEPGEADLLACAKRELAEETGCAAEGEFRPLAPVRQPGGKWIHAWSIEGDYDAAAITSNSFTMEWPPRSGRFGTFPEVDRAAWFGLPLARQKILKGQVALLDQLEDLLAG